MKSAISVHLLQGFCQIGPAPKRRIVGMCCAIQFLCRDFLPLRDTQLAVQGAGVMNGPGNPVAGITTPS